MSELVTVIGGLSILGLCIWWMKLDDQRMEDRENGVRQSERDYLSRMYSAKRNVPLRKGGASQRDPITKNRIEKSIGSSR